MIAIIPICIQSMKSQDDQLFMTNLYLTHRGRMLNIAAKVMRDALDYEDVINEACLRLIGKVSFLRSLNSYKLEAYVVVTVRNTALNMLKQRKRERASALSDGEREREIPSDEEAIDANLLREVDAQALSDALISIGDAADILRMRYYQQMKDAEIAKTLGIGQDSVRVYISRAKKKLREALEGSVE